MVRSARPTFRLRIALAALLCLLGLAAHSTRAQTKLFSFKRDGKWGYKNASGKVVIKPQFDIAYDFLPEGIAAVDDDYGWAYIDTKGHVLIRPFTFDNGPDDFHDGLARFVRDGKFGFFDKKASVAIPPQFDFAFPFQEGLSAVCMACRPESEGEHASMVGGKWGYINLQGVIVIPFQFDLALPFEHGTASVKLNGESVFIDKNGSIVPPVHP